MKLQNSNHSFWPAAVQALFLFAWLTNLIDTDSYYTVYVLCALLGGFCLYDNYQKQPQVSRGTKTGILLLSAVFALAVVTANYPLFQPYSERINLFNMACTLPGGFFLAYHVLFCAVNRLPLSLGSDGPERKHPVRFFFLCYGSIAAVFLLYLFFVGYPGYLSTDSFTSLNQIQSGEYLNNNPFWYTMFIKVFVGLGEALFGEINAAVACYSTAQILILSACFAYCLVTLYQSRIPAWCIVAAWGIYTLLPYNITYSITMWKDILFSASALLIAASLYRLLKDIGRSRMLNYVVFVIGSVGFCLMRTNGWYAYLVTAVVMLFTSARSRKKLLWIMAVILVLCWVLINPVQAALGVGQTDFVETMSVPLQQIARVVAQGCQLEEQDRAFLEEIFWLDRVAELYSPEIVDPIKFETIRTGGKEFLKENLGEFIKVWLRIGAQYPGEYLEAWVELTKGFWNGGYYFWIYLAWSYPELSGIGGFAMDNPVKDLFEALFRYMEKPVIMQPFCSIGLHAWMVVACLFACAAKKRKEFLLTLPVLVLLAGLWVGTPVYAEYRYAYPMFTTYPLILCATIFSGAAKTDELPGQGPADDARKGAGT